MKRDTGRSSCGVNRSLEVIGDSWSLLIVRDMIFGGCSTFKEFSNSPERISTNILSDRLKNLTEHGIISKDGRGPNTTYALTPKGLDLLPILLNLMDWSQKHVSESRVDTEMVDRLVQDPNTVFSEEQRQFLMQLSRNSQTSN